MNSNNHFAPNFLAENIRFLRKRRGLSQEELAHQAGLNRGNIASYENGTAEPKINNILKLSEVFEVPLEELITRNMDEDKATPGHAPGYYPHLTPEARVSLDHFSQRAEELQAVLTSFNVYHRFKMKSLDALPKDLQMMVINFEELFEVSQVLFNQYRDLLFFVKDTLR